MRSILRNIRSADLRGGAAAGICVGSATLTFLPVLKGPISCEETRRRHNVVLANRHRVALCSWPISGGVESGDSRVSTLTSLFQHVKKAGYDGVECNVGQMRDFYFKNEEISDSNIAAKVRDVAGAAGSAILGAIHLVLDGERIPGLDWTHDFNDADFEPRMRQAIQADRDMGARYITYQVALPPRYVGTPFEWRNDEAFLQLTVQRLCNLADMCWAEGLNVYFETHIDRISEDPVFFLRVLKLAAIMGYNLEVNGDLSHYIYRGFTKGSDIEGVLPLVNHMHIRMARVHGDLSANVEDFDADLKTGGAAFAAMEMVDRVAAAGCGLSSRTVCGETGPIHLVKDTISLDERMVPLLRKMAEKLDSRL